MNILHISDIHFRRAYEQCEDGYKGMLFSMQNPLIPLDYCLKKVLEKDKIDLLIISGDLTEDGEAEDYAFLRKHIEGLIGETKIIVTLGNHDKKANFRTGWLGEAGGNSPYNQISYFENLCVVSFDSSLHGYPNGEIVKEQMNWLSKAFEVTKEKPVILVTHHHFLKNQSTIPPLEGIEEFLEALKSRNILCILNGHTHHHYRGTVAGKPYFTADSMSFCGEDGENGLVRFEERYGYNLYRIKAGNITEYEIETFTTGKIIKTVFMN